MHFFHPLLPLRMLRLLKFLSLLQGSLYKDFYKVLKRQFYTVPSDGLGLGFGFLAWAQKVLRGASDLEKLGPHP